MSALERINKLTLAHLDMVRQASLWCASERKHTLLVEVADAIAPWIARSEMDTEADKGEAA